MSSPYTSPSGGSASTPPAKSKLAYSLKRSTSSALTRAKTITRQFAFKRKLPQWGSIEYTDSSDGGPCSPSIITHKDYESSMLPSSSGLVLPEIDTEPSLDLTSHLDNLDLNLNSPVVDACLVNSQDKVSRPSTPPRKPRGIVAMLSPSPRPSKVPPRPVTPFKSPSISVTSLNSDSSNTKRLRLNARSLYINVEKSHSEFSLYDPMVPIISPCATPTTKSGLLPPSLSMSHIASSLDSPLVPPQSPARANSLHRSRQSTPSRQFMPRPHSTSKLAHPMESSPQYIAEYFSRGNGLNITIDETELNIPSVLLHSPSPSPSRYSFNGDACMNLVMPLSINNNKNENGKNNNENGKNNNENGKNNKIIRPQLPQRAASRPSVNNNISTGSSIVRPLSPVSTGVKTTTINPISRSNSFFAKGKSKLSNLSRPKSISITDLASLTEPNSVTSLPTLNSAIQTKTQTPSKSKTHSRGGSSKFWPFGSSDDTVSLSTTSSSSMSSSRSTRRPTNSSGKLEISHPMNFVHLQHKDGTSAETPIPTTPLVSPTRNKRFSDYNDTLSMISLPSSSTPGRSRPQRPQRPDDNNTRLSTAVAGELILVDQDDDRRFSVVNKEHANRLVTLLKQPQQQQQQEQQIIEAKFPSPTTINPTSSRAHGVLEHQHSANSMFSAWTVPTAEFVEQHTWLNDQPMTPTLASWTAGTGAGWSPVRRSNYSSMMSSPTTQAVSRLSSSSSQPQLGRRASSLLPSPIMMCTNCGDSTVSLNHVVEEKYDGGWI